MGVLSNRNSFNNPKGKNMNIISKLYETNPLGRNGPLFSERSQFGGASSSIGGVDNHVKY